MRTRTESWSALLAGLLFAALGAAACSRAREPVTLAAADPATVRRLPEGEVVGGLGRYGAQAWFGIPFAKAPVGDLRWRAPRPAEPWTGVREALSPPAPCVQYASPMGGVDTAPPNTPVGREDCLALSVWTPPFAPDAVPTGNRRLPVMVWIHGGGNSIGQVAFYEGGRLAVEENVVVVAVQYRLGPLGWFRHPALRAGADTVDASGNFGTHDLVRALEWVRDDVAAFGGDPGNVTIFGESAGGQNVYSLLLSPAAHGLFQRAIVQSGGLRFYDASESEAAVDADAPGHAQSSTEAILRLLVAEGRAADRAAATAVLAKMGDAETAAWLRSLDPKRVLLAYEPMKTSGMIDMPRVIAEGTVVPAGDPVERLRAGDWARVPVIAGTNRDENRLFLFADPRRIEKRLWILPRFVDEPTYLATADAMSRQWKATGADAPARAMQASAGAAGPPVFVYRFDWDEEPTVLGADLSKTLGATHGFEIPFVFGHSDLGRAGNVIFEQRSEPGREALSRAMRSYWAQFARSGDPGRGSRDDLPHWAPWQPDGPSKTLVLDTPESGGIHMTPIEESMPAIVAAVGDDPRVPTPEARCSVFAEMTRWGRGFGREDYLRAGCGAFPLPTAN
ncbi:MAG: carboxylesterase/lipase family protein [Alphaproteobacteria bacterium]